MDKNDPIVMGKFETWKGECCNSAVDKRAETAAGELRREESIN